MHFIQSTSLRHMNRCKKLIQQLYKWIFAIHMTEFWSLRIALAFQSVSDLKKMVLLDLLFVFETNYSLLVLWII